MNSTNDLRVRGGSDWAMLALSVVFAACLPIFLIAINVVYVTDSDWLYTYNWCTDALQWSLLSKAEKVELALRDLQLLYPEVNVAEEYAGGKSTSEDYLKEAFSVDWWGLTFYDPGQFLSFYPSMARPQGNIYFAGAHLSSSLGWIRSALESSRRTVRQLALQYGITDVEYL